jgi:predicted pyridoxine 5'-phosphate oxidase superfamily flavin-nucleotide-binding protein
MRDNESPFHRGEKEIQARLGIQDKMEAAGRRMIRTSLVQQHREFFSQLPFLLVGTADEAGRPCQPVERDIDEHIRGLSDFDRIY